ncbi:MAG TPA: phosphoglucomutase (alpha-D-glucose-1,6-bisphosphate-dependent) [Candidatus Acidoferrum sp.]|nr:phosphoglucomutase (alpha-D-glucose-1,6-bisphosphate-dependent) [Candidatus Acidoferrum sp.]
MDVAGVHSIQMTVRDDPNGPGHMTGAISPLAGKPAPDSLLADIPKLVSTYYTEVPDPAIQSQRVSFGTSGHRGSSLDCAFNETHIQAISQAIVLYRRRARIDGPLFIGIDTHALSEPAFRTALEVFAANDVDVWVDSEGGYTPTPAVSHAILSFNAARQFGLSDGIVITPSHNPPESGGFKYNPPNGGPADTDVTGFIETTANELIAGKLAGVRRIPFSRARKSSRIGKFNFMASYVSDLPNVIDMDSVRGSGVRIGIDPLGGASLGYWPAIIDRYELSAKIVNKKRDPTFGFMTVDWDGKIRMDCSSRYAMARLVELRDTFDIAFANDTDADRHGIVCPSVGLMKPNDYLVAAIAYLFTHRTSWPECAIGKTVVSSAMIDRVARKLGRRLVEVPVGFKWFTSGLLSGSLGFGGEESAGASFLRGAGSVWTTDKDGLILCLLAAEMIAKTGMDPQKLYREVTSDLGVSFYDRIEAPATAEQRQSLGKAMPESANVSELAGEPIQSKLSRAPGNNEPSGGIKVATANGWFAARPSGTEDIYKIYAESFLSEAHLRQIQMEARQIVARLL